ncbi:MAG: hypothetical protein AAGA54_12985 [Myxococcota bacterium]
MSSFIAAETTMALSRRTIRIQAVDARPSAASAWAGAVLSLAAVAASVAAFAL